MTDPRPRSPRTFVDPDLAADVRRDLGVDTLFFICAIEAALGVHIDNVDTCANATEEIAQLDAGCLDEAA